MCTICAVVKNQECSAGHLHKPQWRYTTDHLAQNARNSMDVLGSHDLFNGEILADPVVFRKSGMLIQGAPKKVIL